MVVAAGGNRDGGDAILQEMSQLEDRLASAVENRKRLEKQIYGFEEAYLETSDLKDILNPPRDNPNAPYKKVNVQDRIYSASSTTWKTVNSIEDTSNIEQFYSAHSDNDDQ